VALHNEQADRAMRLPLRIFSIVFVCMAVFAAWNLCACGYRMASSVRPMPEGIQSLGIPAFSNLTQGFRLEQQVTRAVLAEFASRTRIRIVSSSEGVDAVLYGEIRNLNSNPVTFGADTFGSAFLVSVYASVRLIRPRDGKVLWEKNDFLFRERYVLNARVTEFFSEQNPALERLARDFAASLAATVLNQ